jgi:translation initiation factor 6 (eIF-6)
MGDKQLQVIQQKMQTVIKKKLRHPKHMKDEVLYAHGQVGEIGIDHIRTLGTLVNVNRLMLLVNCLSQDGEMKHIDARHQCETPGLDQYDRVPKPTRSDRIYHTKNGYVAVH